jgi:hypothetical protein
LDGLDDDFPTVLLLFLDFVVTGDGAAIAETGTWTDVGGPTTFEMLVDASSELAVLVLARLTTLALDEFAVLIILI